MARITVEDCLKRIPNLFDLVLTASKRSRRLANGAESLVEWENDKPTVVALREIAEGHVDIDILEEDEQQKALEAVFEDDTSSQPQPATFAKPIPLLHPNAEHPQAPVKAKPEPQSVAPVSLQPAPTTESKAQPEAATETVSEPQSVAPVSSQPAPTTESTTESKAEPDAVTEPETEAVANVSEANAETADSIVESEPDKTPEPQSMAAPDTEPTSGSDSEEEQRQDSQTDSQTDSQNLPPSSTSSE